MILLLILVSIGSFVFPASEVKSAGGSSVTLNPMIDTLGDGGWSDASGWENWVAQCETEANTAYFTAAYTSQPLGWGYSDVAGGNKWQPEWIYCSFNVTAYQAEEISSIVLRLYVVSRQNDFAGWNNYYAVYTGNPSQAYNPALADCNNWYDDNQNQRISNVVSYSDTSAGVWIEFDIKDYHSGLLDYVTEDEDGLVPFYVLTTNQALKYSPATPSGGGPNYYNNITVGLTGSGFSPELVITYVESAESPVVDHDTNDAVDSTYDGSENVTAVSWGSPRAVYKSDADILGQIGLYMIIEGDSGARFTAGLVDSSGNELTDTLDDSIRVDGNYDWWIPDIDAFDSGFIRAWALTDNTTTRIYSKWGYLSDEPDDSQRTNDIYSVDTNYPQYDYEFSSYVVTEGDLMFIHWKTNIDGDTELADYGLSIRKNGDADVTVYDETLEDMGTDYYECTANNSAQMLHWRYAIFVMDDSGSGFNNYNGMVIDLDVGLMATNKGFYQPVILDWTDNVTLLTWTHSAYWYLDADDDGIACWLSKDSYSAEDTIIYCYADVGEATRASTYLPDLYVSVNAWGAGGTIQDGRNQVALDKMANGEYEARFTFAGGASVENYEYVHDVPFSVVSSRTGTGGASDSLMRQILAFVTQYGLNDTAGKWLILIVGMVILFIVFFKSPILRVTVPLLWLGLFIATKWVDTWIVVLLALVAGGVIAQILRKKLGGS